MLGVRCGNASSPAPPQIKTQRSGFDLVEEEGACGCGAFAAQAEAERSRLLLTWWLGWRDSNPLYRSQSPVCYHYTTSQYAGHPAKTARRSRAVAGKWGGIWGSNPRHPEPQSGALPTELIPPYQFLRREGGQTAAPNLLPPSGVGTPRGTRTPDLLLRRQLLYPAELLAHVRCTRIAVERVMGIEPTYPAWKAGVLPLNYTRKAGSSFSHEIISYHPRGCQQLFSRIRKKAGAREPRSCFGFLLLSACGAAAPSRTPPGQPDRSFPSGPRRCPGSPR